MGFMLRHPLWTALILLASTAAFGQDPCAPTPSTLCLNNDRFQIEVEYMDFFGNPETPQPFATGGMAQNRPFDENWGAFWFFDSDNTELLIHMFRGCSFNDRYWVFYAATTNVEYTVEVTDTSNGEVRNYESTPGQPFQPIQDTEAFATCPKSGEKTGDWPQISAFHAADKPSPAARPVRSSTIAAKGSCVSDANTVCLLENRFAVTADAFGGNAKVIQAAPGSAAFAFSNPTFYDLHVNVVDGRAGNGQYWVKYGLFDPVDVTIEILDTLTGNLRTYNHSASDPLVVFDNQAFAEALPLTIDATLAGSYFASDRDGEGFIVDITEINGVPTLILYFFTYANDGSGRQAWVVGSAPIIGNKSSVPVIIASGGQYGPNFDPASVTRSEFGFVQVEFPSCEEMIVRSESPLFGDLRYSTVRLSPTPIGVAGVCANATSTAIAKGINVDGGYAGSWFNPDRSGEGLIFNIATLNGVPTIIAFYFTYANDGSGQQAWLVGSAPISGNTAQIPMVITSGTGYGDAFDASAVVRDSWGTLNVMFSGCNSANVQVTSASFGNQSFSLQRVAPVPQGVTGDCQP